MMKLCCCGYNLKKALHFTLIFFRLEGIVLSRISQYSYQNYTVIRWRSKSFTHFQGAPSATGDLLCTVSKQIKMLIKCAAGINDMNHSHLAKKYWA